MNEKIQIIDEIIFALDKEKNIETKEQFIKLQNSIYSKYKISKPIPNIAFIERYNILIDEKKLVYNPVIFKLFRKRAVRSLSWISVISLLTKPYSCPGQCIYCPTYPELPKSYITNEPAVMRAELNKFDAIKQVQNRLRSLEITGHNIDKCDIRIIGWTWWYYDSEYREEFIKNIFDACSTYSDFRKHILNTSLDWEKYASFTVKNNYQITESKTLEEAKKRNETSACRVIWIAVETRPDFVTIDEIKKMRKEGITRVEIWYQTTIDEINILNKRGHTNKESIEATKLLKDAWFKIVAHIMPNLLGSNPEMDILSLSQVFDNPLFRPDELKIYPMVVTAHSELEQIWRNGWHDSYDDKTLIELMARMQDIIPEYVRLNRMYRDIPASEILAWSKLANLRQVTDDKMLELWLTKKDISSREIRLKSNNPQDAILDISQYDASWWKEYFLQFIDSMDRTIFSLLRLRVPSEIFTWEKHFIPELQDAAIIREVHTFWDQLRIWENSDWTGQHMWFWKRLLEKAEEIIKNNYREVKKIAVISWVWVRQYYEKRGYRLEGEYMIKYL